MTNPLLEFHELPPFPEIQAGQMVAAFEQVVAESRVGIELLLREEALTYRSLVHGREELEDRVHQVWSTISHMNAVVNSSDIRRAHQTCLEVLTDYQTEMGQNKVLFEAYLTVRENVAFESLETAEKKVAENALRDFRLSGIDLNEKDRSEFSQLARELSELGSTFNNNVLDATQAWTRNIADVDDLPGIPDSLIAAMAQAARAREEEGYLLTLDAPCYLAIVTYCEDRNLRRDMYLAYGTRAGPNSGDFDNTTVMERILKARYRQAQLLGFNNFAELSVERKMAGSAGEVLEFLEDLGGKSRLPAEKELAEIETFASDQGAEIPLAPWDVTYYAEKLKKASFDISEEELRPYFPAESVLEGAFEVVRRLFDVEVVPVSDMPVWHEDVKTFQILRDGEPLARFYIDLYTRENKQGGAWMDVCRVRRRSAAGQLCLPIAFLTCNFSCPVGDDPALLTHPEVVTLFHEFGHGLHHMLTAIEAEGVSGINGVAWDAVELPSQFMENFCWQADALAFISGHYQTGDSLPEAMLGKLLSARNFQAAMQMVRQLELGLFDFRLHANFDPGKEDQIQATLDEVRKEIAVVTPPREYSLQHGFSHIFGGGYAAGYYSYKWAEVLSADAFSRFIEDGIFNRQTGEDFLSTILERGGSEDAMDLFIRFRGRKPEVDALLRQDGIATG
ncbi:MAG: M3 family metallopeptidase [Gammaproteobacteria bacterium]|jgi:oligopeptidase A|nr:M3 family metallopeptidase [Gammaproteobacteria bacterium]MBT4494617.1 M3 family metallopeptidase [Gammaproteobacteria bacterium]MBT7371760.1 M3 family metallopeptidase [Gammaproteobacteria bacterium]